MDSQLVGRRAPFWLGAVPTEEEAGGGPSGRPEVVPNVQTFPLTSNAQSSFPVVMT